MTVGYIVATNEHEDRIKAGVVDPKKVTRAALENASSIAGLLLTTECLVAEGSREGRRIRLIKRRDALSGSADI